jgi:hypothetical protein
MKTTTQNAREQKGLKLRWHNFWEIDQALISRVWKWNQRKPTRDQVIKLASLLDIDLETIIVAWLRKNLYEELVRISLL